MATRRTTFDKLQRERAKKAKAAAKRDRRLDKDDTEEVETDGPVIDMVSPDDPQAVALVLAQIELIHEQFAAKELDYEDFEKKKVALLARLTV